MTTDSLRVPEFWRYDSYKRFARRVCRERRFATDAESQAFIATVLATAEMRLVRIEQGQVFFRAQLGTTEVEWKDEDGETRCDISGHNRERMVPKPELVTSGRANATGIAHLYLARIIHQG
ncbi:hypothetical protein [Azospirillum largimobile]